MADYLCFVVAGVEEHLSNVLLGEFAGFQVNEEECSQYAVVEN